MIRRLLPRPCLEVMVLTAVLAAPWASAQAQAPAKPPPPPVMKPPEDPKALVKGPDKPGEVPSFEQPVDGTTATLSAGGMWSTGNSRLFASTVNGAFELRKDANGFGASVLGNYGRSAPPGEPMETTAQNLQGRLRYDRYLSRRVSLFMITTGRHDEFQGLDARLNLDPGVRYLFLEQQSRSLWGEVGYDFQYDVRDDEARILLDESKQPLVGPDGQILRVDKTAVDHSGRLFLGFRFAFNPEVTLSTGAEYLQSVIEVERYRFNVDALLAAQLVGGLSFGAGFGARFDNAPLSEKEKLDTSTTATLIYTYSDIPEPPKCPACPECPPAPK